MDNYAKNNIFLIGGYDLEMKSIIQLLDDNKYIYIDNSLYWNNAKLSSYRDVLQKYADDERVIVYGIELIEDIEPPKNYIAIDHHNENSVKPSVLIQVAKIIKCELTRWQKLIAANDSGYIPAMRALGATDIEIAEIRKQDRAAQGVTPIEEELAEVAINNIRIYGDKELLVVKSLSSKFSPICDRLYPYNNLIIYTDREFTYYGERSEELMSYNSNIDNIYYGGGAKGFWGIPRDSISSTEIAHIVDKIIKIFSDVSI